MCERERLRTSIPAMNMALVAGLVLMGLVVLSLVGTQSVVDVDSVVHVSANVPDPAMVIKPKLKPATKARNVKVYLGLGIGLSFVKMLVY